MKPRLQTPRDVLQALRSFLRWESGSAVDTPASTHQKLCRPVSDLHSLFLRNTPLSTLASFARALQGTSLDGGGSEALVYHTCLIQSKPSLYLYICALVLSHAGAAGHLLGWGGQWCLGLSHELYGVGYSIFTSVPFAPPHRRCRALAWMGGPVVPWSIT